MTMSIANRRVLGIQLVLGLLVLAMDAHPVLAQETYWPEASPQRLSKLMNAVPPAKQFLCVQNGAGNQALHPDRAPFAAPAMQGPVMLLTGAAPQLGLNFQLPVGDLIYSNQMSSLGKAEPSPAIGASEYLSRMEGSDLSLPWSEARWHAGEDIIWQGKSYWLDSDQPRQGGLWGEVEAYQVLQLAPGIYQAVAKRWAKTEQNHGDTVAPVPEAFREPWFDGRGLNPPDELVVSPPPNVMPSGYPVDSDLSSKLAAIGVEPQHWAQAFPVTMFDRYPNTRLELESGRLTLEFERSAAWPRSAAGHQPDVHGMAMAESAQDQYGNSIRFDRVPDYGWHTDCVAPNRSRLAAAPNGQFNGLPTAFEYAPPTMASRLPHKRLRTVQLTPKDPETPTWHVLFVWEHPESDRISATETANEEEWKSIYSHLPGAKWDYGRVPELHDETTLLTVQAYKASQFESPAFDVPRFKDDYSVWEDTTARTDDPPSQHKRRLNPGIEYAGDHNGDGFCGLRGVDDDGDGLIDEDPEGRLPFLYKFQVSNGCEPGDADNYNCWVPCDPAVESCLQTHIPIGTRRADYNPTDDNEDGIADDCTGGICVGVTDPMHILGSDACTDPAGDKDGTTLNGHPCPGLCGVDDDGDGLVDEDPNGYVPYLDVDASDCQPCQDRLIAYDPNQQEIPGECLNADGTLRQTHENTGCLNPLYWIVEDGSITSTPAAPMAAYDDNENGLIDEDSAEDPLLVNIREVPASGVCAGGAYPYIPRGVTTGGREPYDSDCRSPVDESDPWTYQVQYVYARTNPYWLLFGRRTEVDEPEDYGRVEFNRQPKYYYFVPFSADLNGNGTTDTSDDILYWDDNGVPMYESNLLTEHFDGRDDMVVDSLAECLGETESCDGDGKPNVHPDCVPNPNLVLPHAGQSVDFRTGRPWNTDEPNQPSDIHLIKRIVRVRPDANRPSEFIEKVWLYRYNDIGFLKAVFDPADVDRLIEIGGEAIQTVDDILKYGDDFEVAGKPLIMHASQWYTYYDAHNWYLESYGNADGVTIPECYDWPPFDPDCDDDRDDAGDPINYMPMNGCDGERLWGDGYEDERHVDPPCSPLMRQDCGTCFGPEFCYEGTDCGAYGLVCDCQGSLAEDPNQLAQMGIPGAVPRSRRFLIKTARVRGADEEMHLYRFDYLGAAGSVHDGNAIITSYADPHHIAIVDELVEQTADEFDNPQDFDYRNEFYIYEDRFRLEMDPSSWDSRAEAMEPATGGDGNAGYGGGPLYDLTSHYLYFPVKVKTRRIVTMNYYGIAINDRLIVTPGYDGDFTSLLNDEVYELTNKRGQAKHVYDQSWVATLRNLGADAIKEKGRVFTQLFGGEGGWHSVLGGVAWGSGGGNIYDQQCRTEEILEDVPIQRVRPDDLVIQTATKHFERNHDNDTTTARIKDMPLAIGVFAKTVRYPELDVNDPAGTIGDRSSYGDGNGCGDCSGCASWLSDEDCLAYVGCDECDNDYYCPCSLCPTCMGCTTVDDRVPGIDLHNQEPVVVGAFPGETGTEGDGYSVVRYHYDFYGEATNQQRVKWKYEWTESVSESYGGQGTTGLTMTFFDSSGRMRLVGRGAGDGADPPGPAAPFYWDYVGYDDLGRHTIDVRDIDTTALTTCGQEDAATCAELGWSPLLQNAVASTDFARKPLSAQDTPANLITQYVYNDAGMLVSRVAGITESDVDFALDLMGADVNVARTDFKYIPKREVVSLYERGNYGWDLYDEFLRTYFTVTEQYFINTEWLDPNSYYIEYEGVETKDAGLATEHEQVHGTTTVNIMTREGRFLEQRTIARPDGSTIAGHKIEDFGWAVSLTDYEWDGSIGEFTELDDAPGPLLADCGNGLFALDCDEPGEDGYGTLDVLETEHQGFDERLSVEPAPIGDETAGLQWPPDRDHQIVTLSRTLKKYEQPTTLKPTKDIVTRTFDMKDDVREIAKSYKYDLEDKIAWQRDPDGTITRFLFDSKRRPAKLFKGSIDGCPSWMPPGHTGSQEDDMLLREHYLYNDGDPEQEWTSLSGGDGVTTLSNKDFPRDAGKLVRTRRYMDDAEPCEHELVEGTHSRDTVYLYDWRGRLIIAKEVVVGFGGATLSKPTTLSTTVTVYDNLDRPRFVAHWVGDNGPTFDVVEDWSEIAWDLAANDIKGVDNTELVSLSETLYDDRGRVYETRQHSPSQDLSAGYSFTRTYRDDLDRTVMQLRPGSATTSEYDSLGRVLSTSTWTYDMVHDRPELLVELTRTETTYDPFGRAIETVHYDRKAECLDGPDSDDALKPGTAVITYAHHWYDRVGRQIASANYGTNTDDGYVNSSEAPTRHEEAPVWTGTKYVHGESGTAVSPYAIITVTAYDAAGRAYLTRDPMGVATRTWYDLLGNTLLTAENYETDDDTGFEGPTRYTAYHYNDGGQLDMIAAVLPTDPTAGLTPADIQWVEDSGDGHKAVAVTPSCDGDSCDVQATGIAYGADVLALDHATTIGAAPNQIAAILYPDEDDPGEPSTTDKLTFAYTLDGKVARRTDQRGVVLDFSYGTGNTPVPVDQLTEVSVVDEGDGDCDTFVKSLIFDYDQRGRLVNASAFNKPSGSGDLRNRVTYTYNRHGHLLGETLDPLGDGAYERTTQYDWSHNTLGGQLRHLLHTMEHPSGRMVHFDYGQAGGTNDRLTRMIGVNKVTDLSDPDNNHVSLVDYDYTAGGRMVAKRWGNVAVELDLTSGGLDTHGRIADMTFVGGGNVLNSTIYGHDKAGNRLFSRIEQVGHKNDRSYLYEYDRLHRLVQAGRGMLNRDNDGFETDEPVVGKAWNLDVLGNFNGSPDDDLSVVEFDDRDFDNAFDPAIDRIRSSDHHLVNLNNEITERVTDAGHTAFTYDAAGNLIKDDKHHYFYDAWNRIVRIVRLSDSCEIAKYGYDALGRRVHKQVFKTGALNTDDPGDLFYYDGNRVIDQYRGDGTTSQFYRSFVYGLQYIDEIVAQFERSQPTAEVECYLIQDANYTVVAAADRRGDLLQQFGRTPYGTLYAADDDRAHPIDFEHAPERLITPFGHQGLLDDLETGLVYNRARYYRPEIGRFLQRDPNETALVIMTALLRNAQATSVLAGLSALSQYGDGMSLYGYLRNNPFASTDPSGAFSVLDNLAATANAMFIRMKSVMAIGWRVAKLIGLKESSTVFAISSVISAGRAAATSWTLGEDTWGILDDVWADFKGGWAKRAGFSLFLGNFLRLGDAAVRVALMAAAAFGGYETGGGIYNWVNADNPYEEAFAAIDIGEGAIIMGMSIYVGGRMGGRTYCFVEGTMVSLADGSRMPIEKLVVGDAVLCSNDPSAVAAASNCTVTQTTQRWAIEVIDLEVQGDVISSTLTHYFWVRGRGWIMAKLLEPGMLLLTSDGTTQEIVSLSTRTTLAKVHDIEVEPAHCYYVGDASILVHNPAGAMAYSAPGEAVNAALEWLAARGVTELPEFKPARFGVGGGMTTRGGHAGFRVEWDPNIGAHVNVWKGKVKGPHFRFPGNERAVRTFMRRAFCGA